jgi:hypothetical protein
VEAYVAGLITIEDLRSEKEKMDSALQEEKNKEIYNSKIDEKTLEKKIRGKIKSIWDAVEMLPIEQVKILLRQIISKVVIKKEV